MAGGEPFARLRLRQMLADHSDISVAGEAEPVDQARELVRSERPDLILLDIRMPGADGFALIEGLHLTPMPYIIFVTAYAEHAVEAFDAEAVDYLLKPLIQQPRSAYLFCTAGAIRSSQVQRLLATEEVPHEGTTIHPGLGSPHRTDDRLQR
jgi:DNA-binding LytR/AlgR family response regulator